MASPEESRLAIVIDEDSEAEVPSSPSSRTPVSPSPSPSPSTPPPSSSSPPVTGSRLGTPSPHLTNHNHNTGSPSSPGSPPVTTTPQVRTTNGETDVDVDDGWGGDGEDFRGSHRIGGSSNSSSSSSNNNSSSSSSKNSNSGSNNNSSSNLNNLNRPLEEWSFNCQLRAKVCREVKRPGRDFSVLFKHLSTVQGTLDVRRSFVRDITREALRFKRKALAVLLKQFEESLVRADNSRNRAKAIS